MGPIRAHKAFRVKTIRFFSLALPEPMRSRGPHPSTFFEAHKQLANDPVLLSPFSFASQSAKPQMIGSCFILQPIVHKKSWNGSYMPHCNPLVQVLETDRSGAQADPTSALMHVQTQWHRTSLISATPKPAALQRRRRFPGTASDLTPQIKKSPVGTRGVSVL